MPSKPLRPRDPESSPASVGSAWTRHGPEVFYASEPIVTADAPDVERLKSEARSARRHRARLCTHLSLDDPLHEMFIVHSAGTYVRPHRHVGKSESFHVVDGIMDVAVFDEGGGVVKAFRMGPYGTGHVFYCRLNQSAFHSFVFRTPLVVFQEITNGPFDPSRTQFAPWAPPEDDVAAAAYFSWLQDASVPSTSG